MVVYPFVEGTGVGGAASPQLTCLLRYTHSSCGELRRLLTELFQALAAALPRINSLFSADGISMSDAIIIQAVYIAIGPFFVVESSESEAKGKRENVVLSTLGNSAMRGLRLDALSIIRSVSVSLILDLAELIPSRFLLTTKTNGHGSLKKFSRHLSSCPIVTRKLDSSGSSSFNNRVASLTLPRSLRDGRSIRTVSALLLQLVQTSARDVRTAARRISKTRQNRVLRNQDNTTDKVKDVIFDEQDVEVRKTGHAAFRVLMAPGDTTLHVRPRLGYQCRENDCSLSDAKVGSSPVSVCILHHFSRSGKGKLTKNSNEAEYRVILDNLISDLLVVLYWPEWPAASLILSVICKFMVCFFGYR